MDRPLRVVALLSRTSDRIAAGSEGAEVLADAVAERAGVAARRIGERQPPREAHWRDDLRDSRGILLEAGGQVQDALAAGERPALFASDCSICLTTLPALDEDVVVLWLDAHADFNTPETTPSHFLGGMCLAAACGLWEAGLADRVVDPSRVVMCGVRDVDAGERPLLTTHGVGLVERPSAVAGVLAGRRVYVHLDLDVVDPGVLPGTAFPVPDGLSDGGLRTLLAEVAEAAGEIVGLEVTSFTAPERARRFATVLEPVL